MNARPPMRTLTARPPQPVAVPPSNSRQERALRYIRWLIVTYLILLVIEGALRKWVFPQFSNALLIVRDPVVIAIYFFAIRARVFPRNGFMISLTALALLSWAAGILVLLPYLAPHSVVLVTAYGVRSNFLHLPLIFILPRVLNLADVKRIGWWTIVATIPMAALMVLQFKASPDSFINRAAGLGEGQQIQTSGGKIRPPATFSFISGAIFYLSAATAFLLHAALSKLEYRTWLLVGAGLSLIVGVGVSGSRGAVLAVGMVIASLAVIMLVRPSAMTSFGRNVLLSAVIAWGVSQVPIFWEGVGILSERFAESGGETGNAVVSGLASRVLGGFAEGLAYITRVPAFGFGLGIGTNGGARMIVGRPVFLLAEGEWARVILESGPILGLGFLIWRTALVCRIGYHAVRQLSLGNTLPIFLFSAGFFALLDGPFGQPNSVGFAVVLNGLCLAAVSTTETTKDSRPPPGATRRRVAGRSAYASRLHGPAQVPANGSVAS